jgi:hypothetical protein
MSRTPTPWQVKQIDDELADGFVVAETGEKDYPVAVCHTGDMDDDAANAAFIVEACNAHERLKKERDALRDAAKEMGKYAVDIRMDWSDFDGRELLSEFHRLFDKALALCKEGGKG